MQMLGLNALMTVAKYARNWAESRFMVAVLNNCDLNMVTWELRGLGGSPKVAATQDFVGLRIERPRDVIPVIDRAMRADRPVVIAVRAHPNIAALPPGATFEQARNFFAALAKGDPDRGAGLKQLMRQLTV